MRNFTTAILIISTLQGCSVISREAGYPGGNIGYLADRHALFARGQEQQVNRYLVMLALLTPLVAETVETTSEAKLSAQRINELYKDIEKLRAASKNCFLPTDLTNKSVVGDIKLQNCDTAKAGALEGSALSFETLSFEVAKSLSAALKQAFDNLEIRANARTLVSLDPSDILKTLLKARRLIPVLQRYLASYRDVAIIFGQSVAESCANEVDNTGKAPQNCNLVSKSFGNLVDRQRTSDADAASLERPINEVFKSGSKALNKGLNWKINREQRAALLQHVNRACKKLDALSQIDDDDADGCTIELKNPTSTENAKTVQESVDNILTDPS